MNRLEKIVATVMISLIPLFFGGCGVPDYARKTTYFYSRSKQASGLPPKEISIETALESDEAGIDNLIKKTENYIGYVSFKKKYDQRIKQLRNYLDNEKYKEAENLAGEIGSELRQDDNTYAKRYYDKVKSFYIYEEGIEQVGYRWNRKTTYSSDRGYSVGPKHEATRRRFIFTGRVE